MTYNPCINPDKPRGFTLIEIIIVVIIIGIVAGVVGVRLTGTVSDASLMSSARSIAAMMAFARYRAVTDGLNYRVNYDIDMRRCWLSVEKEPAPSPDGDSNPVYNLSGRYQELANGVAIRDITTTRKSNIREGTEYTAFMPDGRAERCILHLTNEKKKVYTIITFKGIGRVKVLDYEFTE